LHFVKNQSNKKGCPHSKCCLHPYFTWVLLVLRGQVIKLEPT